jgi:Short C-terminal domain
LTVAVLAVYCACAYAQRDPGRTTGGQAAQIAKDSAAANVVAKIYDGAVSYVRIETREHGAPLNQHPVAIEPPVLRALLSRVQLPEKGNDPVFNSDQFDEIVAPLAEALARVLPEQDVSFAVSGRVGVVGLLAPRVVTTARVFYVDNRMNLIFGLVRQDWESRYRATAYLIPFEPGKRSGPVDRAVSVRATGAAVTRRPDWLVLDPLAPPPVVAPLQPPPPAPAVVIPSVTTSPAAPSVAAPAPAAPPAAPSAAAPSDGDALYRQVAERLKALQKLRDAGAITEEEYQQKRREILRTL